MMYQDRLAVAIKSSGKVLREFKDTVYLPFGCEYALFIKNLHAQRVKLHIEIDGQSVTGSQGFILRANTSFDLERFIKDGNLTEGNRFKFIERTAQVEQHRGIGAEDGLVRIEYEFEREPLPFKTPSITPGWGKPNPYDPYYGGIARGTISQPNILDRRMKGDAIGAYYNSIGSNGTLGNASTTFTSSNLEMKEDYYFACTAEGRVSNDAGITVPGSKSNQTFSTTHDIIGDGVKHVMVLKLLGETETGKLVEKPVTVKAKPKCVTCGHLNKATSKFCSECGTSLEIV